MFLLTLQRGAVGAGMKAGAGHAMKFNRINLCIGRGLVFIDRHGISARAAAQADRCAVFAVIGYRIGAVGRELAFG